ncbi:MAG: hypothetical protein ACR65U_11045 [Methylocystis sp.]
MTRIGQLTAPRRVERRAERSIAALEALPAPDIVLAFLNRLSELLFALARVADQQAGHADMMLGGEVFGEAAS